MGKRLLRTGFRCALLVAMNTAIAQPPSDLVEIGGALQSWNLSAGHIVIDGIRYNTVAGIGVVSHDGRSLPVSALQRDRPVLAYEVDGKITRITLLPENPVAVPH